MATAERSKRTSGMADWSPDDLERAAKYMRELDKSANAKAGFELAKREQDVEIARHNAQSKEAEAHKAHALNSLERTRGEEGRKTIEAKRESEKALMDYKLSREKENLQAADQLARQRDDDRRRKDMEDERMKAAIRRSAEEEIQAERRRSDEHRAKLERENMKARALADAEGRIREQRENEDVFTRQLLLKSKEDRATRLESISATFSHLGESLSRFVLDKPRVTATVVALSALAAGVFVSREGAKVVAAVVQKRLLTPALVRETSRAAGVFGRVRSLFGGGRGSGFSGPPSAALGGDVILNSSVAGRVGELATAVSTAHSRGAPFRNMLFYGPPGTGKTMVAKRLARAAGLDYAIMAGGDVGPLGRDGVAELHKLLDWAESSSRGCVIFIDEADAFLASRSRTAMSEDQRNSLNALLYRTGEASSKFMLVLATNRPGDLDAAVVDRVDESLLFDLPDASARRSLVALYFDKYITRAPAPIAVAPEVDTAFLEGIAGRLEGFSGRGIAKLMLSLQGTVYGRSSGEASGPTVTRDLVTQVLGWKLAEASAKGAFSTAAFDFVSGKGKGTKEPELR